MEEFVRVSEGGNSRRTGILGRAKDEQEAKKKGRDPGVQQYPNIDDHSWQATSEYDEGLADSERNRIIDRYWKKQPLKL